MFSSAPSQNHRLKVTAGTSYTPETHETITVNSTSPLQLKSDHLTSNLWVRIKDYTGYPTTSPKTNPYFDTSPFNQNLFSLTFTLNFTHDVNGNDLVFGNDFDHPIRSYLPTGFGTALKIVKSTLDPSLDGDAYADKPYSYSPGLASWNQFSIGEKQEDDGQEDNIIVQEGGTGSGLDVRKECNIPDSSSSRRTHFQNEEKRKGFIFEKGRTYAVDFGNGYLDFNEFAIRIPGFSFHIGKYVSEKNNVLRYVLKNRATGEIYLVICLTVVLEKEAGDDSDEEGERDDLVDVEDEQEVDDVD
ncbi:DUF1769 domain-containing protein [Aspergillus vadensis CBS 113365]|uniref:DUF1769-domain-containing protein n=1 Tax=Aspergillus vadensis (strain CBS 113365 / IMI 142717 / IBT 24658) TaxID=1448311 RepID=A0A319B221_ASPVC|nr:DUF1769-domain-containing protein [Aspergillus vadensis CBS 113365]PYH65894.1 DUF1769-domain-containing protein [Aspergillus vadensis CBS 113365]